MLFVVVVVALVRCYNISLKKNLRIFSHHIKRSMITFCFCLNRSRCYFIVGIVIVETHTSFNKTWQTANILLPFRNNYREVIDSI